MSTSQKIISCSSLTKNFMIMFRNLLNIEILAGNGHTTLHNFFFFLLCFEKKIRISNWPGDSLKKKYFSRKKHHENLKQFFGKKTFIELSKQAAKNLIIHLYKCYIRKHFKKNRTISSFFLLKMPSGPVTVYQELYPKNYILRHQFESKRKK